MSVRPVDNVTPERVSAPAGVHPLRRVLTVVALIYAFLVLVASLGAPLPVRVVHRDSLEYVELASNLAVNGVFGFDADAPSVRRELLYPLFLAGFMKLGLVAPFDVSPTNFWPVLAVQAALYVAALAMIAERSRTLVSDAVARTAVVLGAAYFPLSKFAFQLLSEALTMALVASLFFVLSRRKEPTERPRLLFSAVLLGLLGLLKSVTLPAMALLPAFLVRARRATWPLALSFALIALSFPAAWITRNYVAFDRFIASTSDGSSALYRGNMKLGYQPQSFSDPMIPEEVRRERARLGVGADAYLVGLTRQRLLDSPGEYALGLLYKLVNLWVGDPRSSDGPVTFVLRCLMAVMAGSQLSLLLRRRDPDGRLLLYFLAYLSVLYTLIYTTPRYFAPATFVLMPLAASALYRLWAVLTRRAARVPAV